MSTTSLKRPRVFRFLEDAREIDELRERPATMADVADFVDLIDIADRHDIGESVPKRR